MPDLDFRELQDLAANILGVDPEQDRKDVSLARDLAADSLDLVGLIGAVEDEYDGELPEEELKRLKSVGDLCTFLEAHAAARSAARARRA